MAEVTDIAIRRATLLARIDALERQTGLADLADIASALRFVELEAASDDPGEAMGDAVRATALRLASLLPESERQATVDVIRREDPLALALRLPELAGRIQALDAAARPRTPTISSHLLEQVAQELEAPADALEAAVMRLRALDLELQAARAAASVQTAAESLRLLLNDLLDLASLSDGRFVAARMRFRIRDVVAAVVESLSARAARLGASLIADVDEAVPDEIVGDPGRVRQVLHTLAGNAVDAARGEVVLALRWQGEPSGGAMLRVCVSVAAPRPRPAVTAPPLARRDSGAWIWHGGTRTGLSLSIVRRLVEQLQGRTWVGRSSDGRDEVHCAIAAEMAPTSDDPAPAHTRRDQATAVALSDARVLLVAAPSEPVDELIAATQSLGCMVISATSMASARAKLLDSGADAVLVVGSLGTAEQARWVEQVAEIAGADGPPRALVVRHGHRGDAVRCRRMGIRGYLSMPCSSRDLGDMLRVLLADGGQGRRASQLGRSALVTRHFLRESRRELTVVVAAPSATHPDVLSMLAALGHRARRWDPAHGAAAVALADADLCVIDPGDSAPADWSAGALDRLAEGARPAVLLVVPHEAAAIPPGAPVDEIAVAPLTIEDLASLLPRLRGAGRSGDVAESIDLDLLARRLGTDRRSASDMVAVLAEHLPGLQQEVRAAIDHGDSVAAAHAVRSLGAALCHLGWRQASEQALELARRCHQGDAVRMAEGWAALAPVLVSLVQSVRVTAQQATAASIRRTGSGRLEAW